MLPSCLTSDTAKPPSGLPCPRKTIQGECEPRAEFQYPGLSVQVLPGKAGVSSGSRSGEALLTPGALCWLPVTSQPRAGLRGKVWAQLLI